MALLADDRSARDRARPDRTPFTRRLVLRGASACLLAAGCVRAGVAPGDEPTAAQQAKECARAVLQMDGFHVRLPDPREPWIVVGERGISGGLELVVVEIYPGSSPDDPPMVRARVRSGRPGAEAGSDAEETARRLERRCEESRRPR